MQKLLEKTLQKQEFEKTFEKNTLTLKQIEKFYHNFNSKTLFGLEYERLSLDKNTLENAKYETMAKIIDDFSKILNWELVFDGEVIIGAKDDIGNSISLEPGCQLEISLKPYENILDIDLNLTKISTLLDKIADIYNVIFLAYGVSPKSFADDIELLNKRRYEIMNNYLPTCLTGELCTKMMRKTAGIQVNIDYKNNEDAFCKLKFLNLIMPFMSALFSNSPIENNSMTSFKSTRSHIWRFTGQNRCNMFYKNIFSMFNKKKNVFKNYINEILNVPMIFIQRGDEIIEINGKINFRQYLKEGYKGHFATMEDYILHQSLCFPDVRLKNYIEIRNHDSQNPLNAVSLCAFYKGLMSYDIEFLLNKFSYLKINDVEKHFELASKNGMDFSVNSKISARDVILNLYKLSVKKLSTKEKIYLNPIFEMIKNNKTNADILIEYGFKNASDVVEFYG